jgi:hypothetical protein
MISANRILNGTAITAKSFSRNELSLGPSSFFFSAAAAAAAASARDDDDRLPLARRRRRRRQRAPARALLQVNNPAVATYCDYATANWRCVPLVHICTGSHTTAFAW